MAHSISIVRSTKCLAHFQMCAFDLKIDQKCTQNCIKSNKYRRNSFDESHVCGLAFIGKCETELLIFKSKIQNEY